MYGKQRINLPGEIASRPARKRRGVTPDFTSCPNSSQNVARAATRTDRDYDISRDSQCFHLARETLPEAELVGHGGWNPCGSAQRTSSSGSPPAATCGNEAPRSTPLGRRA